MEEHKCAQENRFDRIEEKLDRIEEKLDEKFDTYNGLLKEHIERTAILETKQDTFEKSQNENQLVLKEIKVAFDELTAFKKVLSSLYKPIVFLIVVVLMLVFKDSSSSILELLKTLMGAG